MKRIIKKFIRPFYRIYKNGRLGTKYKEQMKPEIILYAFNNKIICKAKGNYKYNLIVNGTKHKCRKKGLKFSLTKANLKMFREGDFQATAWGHHILAKYNGEDLKVTFLDKRIIAVDGKEYEMIKDGYIVTSIAREDNDLVVSISHRGFDGNLKLLLANRKYNQVAKFETNNNKAIITNIEELLEDNDLLRMIWVSDDKVVRAVSTVFEDDKVSTRHFYDFTNIKSKKEGFTYVANQLDAPIKPIKKGYKRVKKFGFDYNEKAITVTFKKKYKNSVMELYLRSLKTNEAELVGKYDVAKNIKITDLDKILDREINYLDRYVLEFTVINKNGKKVDNNWINIKKTKTRKLEDYILYTSGDNRLAFYDNQLLIVENVNNHFTYEEKLDFDLVNNTFTTDFDITMSDAQAQLDLKVESLLSKISEITIYLEDKYMGESIELATCKIAQPSKRVSESVAIDLDKLEESLYYNARLNFKIGVKYTGDYKETGFLTKARGNYSVPDRYLLTVDREDDLVMTFYIGANIYNLNVWETSRDEYEKGVAFQTGREKYFETLHNEDLDEKLVFFEANLGKNYTGNPKYLYEYMISHPEYEGYKYVWAYPDVDSDKIPGNPTLVKRGSEDYFYYLAKAKYWVNNILFPVKEKRNDTVYLQTWHGTPLKKLGFDIECEGPEKQAFGNLYKESLNWDYFLTDNDYGEEKLVGAFHFKKNVIKKGYPINDIYHRSELKDRAVQTLTEEFPVIKDKKVILYAPTWRDLQGDYVRGYDFSLPFDIEELYEKFGNEYVIMVKLHHLIADSLEIDPKYKDFLLNVSYKEDVMELLCITDVLITDYSSVFYDFASAKKPMLFYMYDLDEYINETRGLYVSVDTLPGPIIENNADLVESIAHIDDYNYDNFPKLREFCQDMAKYCDGNSCKNVLDIVIGENK